MRLGDEYRVTMVKELLPTRISDPANYNPATKKLIDRPSTMQDVADFVAEYINSDVCTSLSPVDFWSHESFSRLVSSLLHGS